MRLPRRVPTPGSHDMKKIIQPRMDTDGHGFSKRVRAHSLFVLCVSIRVYPWLKKHLMVWLSLGFWLFTATGARAQIAPAEDFFHSGAQFYISNNVAQAKSVVEMGRKLYPDDEKLKKLEDLLKQQQQQQQSQQDQQKQDQQQKSEDQKDPAKQDQKSSQQQSEDQTKAEEQKQKQADHQQKVVETSRAETSRR